MQENQEVKHGMSLFFSNLGMKVGNSRVKLIKNSGARGFNMLCNNLKSFIESDPRIGWSADGQRNRG